MPTEDTRAEASSPFLRELFDRDSLSAVRVRVDAQQSIYASGDSDDAMYLIESGQVKLIMSSAEGQDCLLAIYTAGDVFGESCLLGSGKRFETASAMQAAVVRRTSRRDFLAEVYRSAAFESLVRHLAARLTERQTAVFDPAGILGRAYWYAIAPLHGLVFRGMVRGIARAATARPATRTEEVHA